MLNMGQIGVKLVQKGGILFHKCTFNYLFHGRFLLYCFLLHLICLCAIFYRSERWIGKKMSYEKNS